MTKFTHDFLAAAVKHGLLSTAYGLRNGVHYGVKIRAPHALVMTLLFKSNQPIRKNFESILKMTFVHARNLGGFVLIYKGLLALGRTAHAISGTPLLTPPGTPAEAWHALLAGWVGGMMIWAKHSSVNEQIVMYLFSRILVGLAKLLAKKGVKPFSDWTFAQTYPYFAAAVWAIVMWLFEQHPKVLQPSLEQSMRYLYHDTNAWSRDCQELAPSLASVAVTGLILWVQRGKWNTLLDLKARL
uniref:Peroxisomal membrane protein 4 n=2 Tax=Hemiselmis andersenii TaxID=464988 RepID=A0A6U4LW24_HEMAN|mmetsp:Transcript_14695/g.35734  ORF Transcript_14695/g.35734 Transcript_14695/m.35734 type:complete len:242 (+) Transcript_14695:33-758(+)